MEHVRTNCDSTKIFSFFFLNARLHSVLSGADDARLFVGRLGFWFLHGFQHGHRPGLGLSWCCGLRTTRRRLTTGPITSPKQPIFPYGSGFPDLLARPLAVGFHPIHDSSFKFIQYHFQYHLLNFTDIYWSFI